MRLNVIKRCLAVVVLLLGVGLFVRPALAEPGDGNGSGGGASAAKPLKFVSATLADGKTSIIDAENIPLKFKFRLLFDKNVVNSAIWGMNRECFTLLSSDNATVPIEVTKVDDTVDPSERQAVFVEPVNALESGESYTLKISPGLVAKNGVSTLGGTTSGRGVTIVFATKKEEPAKASSPAVKEGTAVAPSPEASADRGGKTQNAAKSAGAGGSPGDASGQKATSTANPKAASTTAAPGTASGQQANTASGAAASERTGEGKETKSGQVSSGQVSDSGETAGSEAAASKAPAAKKSGGETAGSAGTASKAAGSKPAAAEEMPTVKPAAQDGSAPGGEPQTAIAASASPPTAEPAEAATAVPAQPEAKSGSGPETATRPIKAEPDAAGQQSAAVSETGSSDPHWRVMIIVLVVLIAGWASAEILYFRRRRADKRTDSRAD